jgi:epoxyqueuosine reductase
MLARLLERLRSVVPCRGVIAVDAEPVLERALARRAGLGWAGGSSCLVTEAHGPWLILGELLVDVELAPAEPGPSRCGTCARCAAACPTGAIVSPGVVDAGRCVAYLTIEHRGSIPRELRPGLGRWLFGCDACQEACPWGRFARAEAGPAVLATVLDAAGFLALDDAGFRAAYRGTALMRAGRTRMARNAAVVLGNLGDPAAAGALTAALRDPEPVVRGHAAWALGRLGVQEELASAASDARRRREG